MQHHRKSLWLLKPTSSSISQQQLSLATKRTDTRSSTKLKQQLWNLHNLRFLRFINTGWEPHLTCHGHKITITALLKELVHCTVAMVLDQLTQHFEFIVFLWFICVVMFQFSIVVFTPTKLTLFLMALIQNSPETFLSYSASSYKQILEMCRLPIQHIPKMP